MGEALLFLTLGGPDCFSSESSDVSAKEQANCRGCKAKVGKGYGASSSNKDMKKMTVVVDVDDNSQQLDFALTSNPLASSAD